MTSFSKSKFVKHEPCPSCGSSDALARYDDGSAYCFAAGCNHFEKATGDFIDLCSHCFHQSNMAKYSDDDTLQAYTDYAMEPAYIL